LLGLWSNVTGPVQNMRHRGDRNARSLCDVPDTGWHFFSVPYLFAPDRFGSQHLDLVAGELRRLFKSDLWSRRRYHH
jgi:hypothetical protein